MKIAILLCGHIRTWEKCKDSFKDLVNYLKTFSKVDIYISTYYSQYGYHPYVQETIGFKEEKFIKNILELFKEIDVKNYIIEEDIGEKIKEKIKDMNEIYHGYLQYLKLEKCLKLLKEEYDFCLKTRFDLTYNLEEWKQIQFEKDTIILDKNNTYPNDHVILLSYPLIKQLPSFIMKEYNGKTSHLSTLNPPHGLLQYFIESHDLKVENKDLTKLIRVVL